MAEIVKNDKNFLIIKMNYEEASKCNFGMLYAMNQNYIILQELMKFSVKIVWKTLLKT